MTPFQKLVLRALYLIMQSLYTKQPMQRDELWGSNGWIACVEVATELKIDDYHWYEKAEEARKELEG